MNNLTLSELAYVYRMTKATKDDSPSSNQYQISVRLEEILLAQVLSVTQNRLVPVDDIP